MQAAFIEAIKAGNVQTITSMLADDPNLAEAKTDNSVSALLLSAYYGNREISHLLRQYKPQLDLFEAAALGDEHQIARILSEQPGLINAFAPDGFTPLGLAAYFGHLTVVSLLVDQQAALNLPANNPQQVTPLHSAVAHQHLQIAQVLLSNGADANARQAQAITPLQQAAHNGQLEMVTLLLEHGADVNQANDLGKTALDYARDDGHSAIVAVLTAHLSGQATH